MSTVIRKTCIVCPLGCHLEAELADDGQILLVRGNTCRRGESYMRDELTDPRRTLTTTVRLVGAENDAYLPVKTDGTIPKGRLFEAMKVLSGITVTAPVVRGDVICEDFLGEGVNLVAGKTVEASSCG
ncbi:MAG: DUF1667 domain-containing protein [Clostridia bacterium]|nr:DUF1667 domain-containing protein [Clostridia bacterium]